MTNNSSRDPVLLSLKDEVATLTINRPQAQNALTLRTIDTLLLMVRALEVDADVKALIIEGNGAHFCAGEDHSDPAQGMTPMTNGGFGQAAAELTTALRRFPKLVITKVRGAAHGLGLEMVAASDVAIAAPDATFAAAAPGDGAGPLALATLGRLMGPKKAADLLFIGETLGAGEAERMGLLSRIVADSDIDDCVNDAARKAVARYTVDFARWKQRHQQSQVDTAAARHGARLTDPASARLSRSSKTVPPQIQGDRQIPGRGLELMPLDE
jgi:2-(1,2-epoxy-1,2-dihydrophenyl)acetyl-CoA isomerase